MHSDTKMFWGGRNWVGRLARLLLAWAGSETHVSFGSIISVNGNDDAFSLQGSCVDERSDVCLRMSPVQYWGMFPKPQKL